MRRRRGSEARSNAWLGLGSAVIGAAFCTFVLLVGAASAGCVQHADDDSPEHAVREFIDRMLRVHGDVQKSKAAFELLASSAQANLAQRAERASAAMGRRVTPEEMLAPSRFYLTFQPRTWSTEHGSDWAVVTAEGDSSRERKQIRCVREQGQWRVVIDLPEVPPPERHDPPR